MTKPRSAQVSLDQTPYYHVVNRCVRRAFLCGVDQMTGQSYEHRREWIEQRIMQLSSIFAIDIAAFAIMSNHYHIVVKINKSLVLNLSDDEVLERWTQLFSSTYNVQQYLSLKQADEPIPDYLLEHAADMAKTYRHRLYDLSWFMRVLNESIARMANKEDGVKGRFWEGRFKSQAILDEAALMSVMAYVDLNPIRANMAQDLTTSEHTSIQARLTGKYDQITTPERPQKQIKPKEQQPAQTEQEQAINAFLERLQSLPYNQLLPFDPTGNQAQAIPFGLEQYLEFTDYLGRAIHPNKKGHIPKDKPAIMQQLGISTAMIEQFQKGKFLESFGQRIGHKQNLKSSPEQENDPRPTAPKRSLKGTTIANRVFV